MFRKRLFREGCLLRCKKTVLNDKSTPRLIKGRPYRVTVLHKETMILRGENGQDVALYDPKSGSAKKYPGSPSWTCLGPVNAR